MGGDLFLDRYEDEWSLPPKHVWQRVAISSLIGMGMSAHLHFASMSLCLYVLMLLHAQRHKNIKAQKHKSIEAQKHRGIETQKHRRLEKHRIIEAQNHRSIETQRHRNTEIFTHIQQALVIFSNTYLWGNCHYFQYLSRRK